MRPEGWAALEQLAEVTARLQEAEKALADAVRRRDVMIRVLRLAGLTQAETAAALGISNQRVSQIERAA